MAKLRAYWLTADQALSFFEMCDKYKLDTVDERTALLNLLAKHGGVQKVMETGKTKDKFIKDLSKHFKLLNVTASQEASDANSEARVPRRNASNQLPRNASAN